MLLAVDIGNTQTLLGVYRKSALITSWRIDTDCGISADVMAATLMGFLAREGVDSQQVGGVVLGTVVPALQNVWEQVSREVFGVECLVARADHLKGMMEVRTQGSGIDRLANAVAGADLYGSPVVVVDLGTATDAEVVGEDGAFLGGFIAPGLQTSLRALVKDTAQLPGIELADPGSVIAETTVQAIQAGVVLGEAARIDGLVRRIWAQLGCEAPVVATGGLSPVVGPLCETVTTINPELTLWGLKLIFEGNAL